METRQLLQFSKSNLHSRTSFCRYYDRKHRMPPVCGKTTAFDKPGTFSGIAFLSSGKLAKLLFFPLPLWHFCIPKLFTLVFDFPLGLLSFMLLTRLYVLAVFFVFFIASINSWSVGSLEQLCGKVAKEMKWQDLKNWTCILGFWLFALTTWPLIIKWFWSFLQLQKQLAIQ